MSTNGRTVTEFIGRPLADYKEHYFQSKEGGTVTKRRYVFADKITDKGKPDKTFRWPKDTDLATLHLYGWEDLKHLKPGNEIILTEGETNVDSASARGLFAVCTPQPTGPSIACLDELAAFPRNTIYISPDNDWDGKGVEKALAWFERLSPIHPDVRWLPFAHPSDGGDLKDLLDTFAQDDDAGARAAVTALFSRATVTPPRAKSDTSVDRDFTPAISAAMLREPPPRTWIVKDLIPTKWPTLYYGDGGVGKSTSASHLACCIATGIPWHGRETKRMPVLFIDAEMDEEEFAMRMWPIARGLGLSAPPEGVFYWRIPKALSNEAVQDFLYEEVERLGIGLIIVDSLTLATHLSDQNAASDISSLIFDMTRRGTAILFLDHHAKQQGTVSDDDRVDPYGSVMKRNLSRSSIYLREYGQGLIRFAPNKVTFSAKWEPFVMEVSFTMSRDNPEQIDTIVYAPVATNDPRVVTIKAADENEQIMDAIQDLMEGGGMECVAGAPLRRLKPLFPAMKDDTLRMRCNRLVRQGRLVKTGTAVYAIPTLLPADPGSTE